MEGIYGTIPTNGETYYFDDKSCFFLPENLILPAAAQFQYDAVPADYQRHIVPVFDYDEDDDQQMLMIKAKIASHPYYTKLLHAYIDCKKVGAPADTAWLLDKIRGESDNSMTSICLGTDPELDEFMEAYYNILVKLKTGLTQPFDEATSFLNTIENQLTNLCKGGGIASSEEEPGSSGGEESETRKLESKINDQELKQSLLHRYGSEITRLKQAFCKKKKRGKLPKEATETLLHWWNTHIKWPYPTEADKTLLTESTGLDQKQINNWFINQRKRHWKPSDEMQFAVGEFSGHLFGEE